jgi:hypothetical protein
MTPETRHGWLMQLAGPDLRDLHLRIRLESINQSLHQLRCGELG